jgi:hypothetical protein
MYFFLSYYTPGVIFYSSSLPNIISFVSVQWRRNSVKKMDENSVITLNAHINEMPDDSLYKHN